MNFDYTDITLPEGGTFRISPSQVSGFFDLSVVWYREQVLGEKVFLGSTATYLGSAIHGIAEAYGSGQPVDRSAVEDYISSITNPDVDKDEIRSLYPGMSEALINEYISTNMPTQVEYQTMTEVKDGIYVGGSVDNRTGDGLNGNSGTIVDYKNASKKPNTEKIPFAYFIQLMSYAYCDRANGVLTDRLRLVYTVRPTKTLPIRVFVVNHQITPDDWVMIENTLELIAETILVSRAQPDLVPLLFKSMNLKQPTPPTTISLFK